MVHVPPATRVTVVPEIVHTSVVCELNATVRPELAVALTVNGEDPNVRFERALKVMVWVVRSERACPAEAAERTDVLTADLACAVTWNVPADDHVCEALVVPVDNQPEVVLSPQLNWY